MCPQSTVLDGLAIRGGDVKNAQDEVAGGCRTRDAVGKNNGISVKKTEKQVKKMLYRKMPKNGDELSILGFGCMRLPDKADGSIDEERAKRQVRYAIDHGVNYVDTAWPYHMGQSEPFVGHALAGGYREKVKLATKLPSWLIEKREDMDTFLNAQLEKLNTDHIDYYLVHALVGDLWDTVEKLGVADFLTKQKLTAASGMQVSPSTAQERISAGLWTPMTGTSARSSTISLTRRTRQVPRA